MALLKMNMKVLAVGLALAVALLAGGTSALQLLHKQGESAMDKEIQIFLKSLEGKVRTLNVRPRDSVEQLKSKVAELHGVNSYEENLKFWKGFSLIFAGKQLQDGRQLHSYNIQKESTIFIGGRLGHDLEPGELPTQMTGTGVKQQYQEPAGTRSYSMKNPSNSGSLAVGKDGQPLFFGRNKRW